MDSTFVYEGTEQVTWIVGDPIELLGALKHDDAKRDTSKDKRRLRFANNPGYWPVRCTTYSSSTRLLSNVEQIRTEKSFSRRAIEAGSKIPGGMGSFLTLGDWISPYDPILLSFIEKVRNQRDVINDAGELENDDSHRQNNPSQRNNQVISQVQNSVNLRNETIDVSALQHDPENQSIIDYFDNLSFDRLNS
ncbi:hypothetical protein GJ496_004683 [Pomphorhynchus laevis]|nr:hypothetical protein GJ496_004683 [Pomphorhynchus laevis]